jgi:hypothetical protein
MSKIYMLFALLLVPCFYSFCKGIDETDTAKAKKQNFIYLTGSLPMVSGYYIAIFERELLTGKSGSLNLSAGYGGWSNWDNGGSVGLLSTHFVSGKRKHHFESDIGLMFHNDNSNFVEIAPVKFNINAGYRIQQRGKPLIFRIGVGWPMVLYTSLGIAF